MEFSVFGKHPGFVHTYIGFINISAIIFFKKSRQQGNFIFFCDGLQLSDAFTIRNEFTEIQTFLRAISFLCKLYPVIEHSWKAIASAPAIAAFFESRSITDKL